MHVIARFSPADSGTERHEVSLLAGLWASGVGVKGPHTEILGMVSMGRKEVGGRPSAHLEPL